MILYVWDLVVNRRAKQPPLRSILAFNPNASNTNYCPRSLLCRMQTVKVSRLNYLCRLLNRSRLKCDRNTPCSSCVRRGCPSICPDGTLVTGKGTRFIFLAGQGRIISVACIRFILSNTQELHNKIEALQSRIKELEAALALLQSKVTSEPHPLLTRSLKAATEGLASKDNGTDDEEDLVDTFGSLTIDTKGETVW
jgi:hypothetical protein